jgi:hypothetical protein
MASANELEIRVERVEGKLDALSTSVDERFDRVDAALVEQRQYTEFGYLQLEAKLGAQIGEVEAKLGARMDAGFAQVDARFARVERKLDQFIDTQSRTNELVERRLRLIEPPRRRPS